MSRFLNAGDLHLGAGADLGLTPTERLDEQEAVVEWIVATANELGVPILFAGDAWERRRPTPAEILAFRRPLEKAIYGWVVIPGNHDVEAYGRPTGYDAFYSNAGDRYLITKPDVVVHGGAWICCLPWAPPSRLVALDGGGDRDAINQRLADGLVEIARGLFAQTTASGPRILLTHWSISGTTGSSGFPVDLMREPVLDAAALEAIGFDAIVAGHIHRPQMIGERGFYVGSPMPLNFGEADHDHSVWLLDVEPGSFSAFQIPVPSRPLKFYDLAARDIGPTTGVDIPLDYDGAVVKLRIRATEEQARRLDLAEIKRQLVEPTQEIASGPAPRAHKVWSIQTEVEREERQTVAGLDETLGDMEAMELYLNAQGYDDDRIEAILERHVSYLEETKP